MKMHIYIKIRPNKNFKKIEKNHIFYYQSYISAGKHSVSSFEHDTGMCFVFYMGFLVFFQIERKQTCHLLIHMPWQVFSFLFSDSRLDSIAMLTKVQIVPAECQASYMLFFFYVHYLIYFLQHLSTLLYVIIICVFLYNEETVSLDNYLPKLRVGV